MADVALVSTFKLFSSSGPWQDALATKTVAPFGFRIVSSLQKVSIHASKKLVFGLVNNKGQGQAEPAHAYQNDFVLAVSVSTVFNAFAPMACHRTHSIGITYGFQAKKRVCSVTMFHAKMRPLSWLRKR